MEASYLLYALLSSMCMYCLWWVLGRRLKGAGPTRNGEEEQPLAPRGAGEIGDGAGKTDVITESGSAVADQSED